MADLNYSQLSMETQAQLFLVNFAKTRLALASPRFADNCINILSNWHSAKRIVNDHEAPSTTRNTAKIFVKLLSKSLGPDKWNVLRQLVQYFGTMQSSCQQEIAKAGQVEHTEWATHGWLSWYGVQQLDYIFFGTLATGLRDVLRSAATRSQPPCAMGNANTAKARSDHSNPKKRLRTEAEYEEIQSKTRFSGKFTYQDAQGLQMEPGERSHMMSRPLDHVSTQYNESYLLAQPDATSKSSRVSRMSDSAANFPVLSGLQIPRTETYAMARTSPIASTKPGPNNLVANSIQTGATVIRTMASHHSANAPSSTPIVDSTAQDSGKASSQFVVPSAGLPGTLPSSGLITQRMSIDSVNQNIRSQRETRDVQDRTNSVFEGKGETSNTARFEAPAAVNVVVPQGQSFVREDRGHALNTSQATESGRNASSQASYPHSQTGKMDQGALAVTGLGGIITSKHGDEAAHTLINNRSFGHIQAHDMTKLRECVATGKSVDQGFRISTPAGKGIQSKAKFSTPNEIMRPTTAADMATASSIHKVQRVKMDNLASSPGTPALMGKSSRSESSSGSAVMQRKLPEEVRLKRARRTERKKLQAAWVGQGLLVKNYPIYESDKEGFDAEYFSKKQPALATTPFASGASRSVDFKTSNVTRKLSTPENIPTSVTSPSLVLGESQTVTIQEPCITLSKPTEEANKNMRTMLRQAIVKDNDRNSAKQVASTSSEVSSMSPSKLLPKHENMIRRLTAQDGMAHEAFVDMVDSIAAIRGAKVAQNLMVPRSMSTDLVEDQSGKTASRLHALSIGKPVRRVDSERDEVQKSYVREQTTVMEQQGKNGYSHSLTQFPAVSDRSRGQLQPPPFSYAGMDPRLYNGPQPIPRALQKSVDKKLHAMVPAYSNAEVFGMNGEGTPAIYGQLLPHQKPLRASQILGNYPYESMRELSVRRQDSTPTILNHGVDVVKGLTSAPPNSGTLLEALSKKSMKQVTQNPFTPSRKESVEPFCHSTHRSTPQVVIPAQPASSKFQVNSSSTSHDDHSHPAV